MSKYTVWKTLKGHNYAVNFVTFSDSGELLASGDDGGNVIIWCLSSGRMFQTLPRAPSEAVSCCWGDDKELFIGYGNGEVKFYEHNHANHRFERTARVKSGSKHVSSLAIHGNRLAGCSGNSIYCWRIESSSLRHSFTWTMDGVREIRTLHFVDRHSIIATTIHEGNCVLLDVLEPSRHVWWRRLPHSIGESALSPDGKYLSITNLASAVNVYELLPTGLRLAQEISAPVSPANNFPFQTCFAESQAIVTTGSDIGVVYLYTAHRGRMLTVEGLEGQGSADSASLGAEDCDTRLMQTVAAYTSRTHHYVASAYCSGTRTHTLAVWRRECEKSEPEEVTVPDQWKLNVVTLLIVISAITAHTFIRLGYDQIYRTGLDAWTRIWPSL